MKVSVDFSVKQEEIATVIYAMWDSDFEFQDRDWSNSGDVMGIVREMIRRHGSEFGDYLGDVCYPDGSQEKYTYSDAVRASDLVFSQFGWRQATLKEVEMMSDDIREAYENGETIFRFPGFLNPDVSDDEVCFKTMWPGRPNWLDMEDVEKYGARLEKNPPTLEELEEREGIKKFYVDKEEIENILS